MTVIILIAVIVILAIWIVSLYNSLVKLRNNRENAFADIDVQLKQRHDLIPQLVETVKGYASHEKETLERVINARNGAISAKTIDDKIMAENVLTSALAGLKITVDGYLRELSRPESQPELLAVAGRNFRPGKQTGCRAPLFQFGHERVEQRSRDIPVQPDRRYVRFQEGSDVRPGRTTRDTRRST